MKSISYPLAVGKVITRVIEAGQGPVLLFVHGLGARADRWTGTVEAMAGQGYRAIACDLPGHGFATKGAACPGDVPGLAEFLLGVLDGLGIGSAVLAGTSLGGHIVAYAATLAPERFKKLVLIGALGIVPLKPETAEGIRSAVKAASREQIIGKLNYVMFNQALVTPALIEEEWRMNNSPGALESLTKIGDYVVDGIARDYVSEKLRAAYRPGQILLVWGEQDQSVPLVIGHACQAALGGPELAVIPQAGHAPYYERPDLFAPLLADFLAREATPSPAPPGH